MAVQRVPRPPKLYITLRAGRIYKRKALLKIICVPMSSKLRGITPLTEPEGPPP